MGINGNEGKEKRIGKNNEDETKQGLIPNAPHLHDAQHRLAVLSASRLLSFSHIGVGIPRTIEKSSERATTQIIPTLLDHVFTSSRLLVGMAGGRFVEIPRPHAPHRYKRPPNVMLDLSCKHVPDQRPICARLQSPSRMCSKYKVRVPGTTTSADGPDSRLSPAPSRSTPEYMRTIQFLATLGATQQCSLGNISRFRLDPGR